MDIIYCNGNIRKDSGGTVLLWMQPYPFFRHLEEKIL